MTKAVISIIRDTTEFIQYRSASVDYIFLERKQLWQKNQEKTKLQ